MYQYIISYAPRAKTCGSTSWVQWNSLVWAVEWSALHSVEMPTTLCVLGMIARYSAMPFISHKYHRVTRSIQKHSKLTPWGANIHAV